MVNNVLMDSELHKAGEALRATNDQIAMCSNSDIRFIDDLGISSLARAARIIPEMRLSNSGDLVMVSVLQRSKPTGMLDAYQNLSAYVARGEVRPAYRRASEAQFEFNTKPRNPY